jgi:hypothetical protein
VSTFSKPGLFAASMATPAGSSRADIIVSSQFHI